MTQKIVQIFSLGICILLIASLLSWPTPVSAGSCVWSAESIPSLVDNILGPAGVDIRDLAFSNDTLTVYAVPGDSVTDNVVFKSFDSGNRWVTLQVPIRADFVAMAPSDSNLVAIANNITPEVYITTDGGLLWQSMGIVREGPLGPTPSAIYDLTIAPLRGTIQYIIVGGKQAGDIANLWYFDFGAVTPSWYQTNTFAGFSPASEVATLTVSSTFALDATVVVVTDNATSNVTLQMLRIDTGVWNNAASFTGFPHTVLSTNLSRLTSASIVLEPDYTSNDPPSRILFIGLTVDGDATANATSGVYRINDTVNTNILINTKIHSLALNGSYLIAGSYDTNNVFRIVNPYVIFPSTPTISSADITKCPGGDNRVVVAWMSSLVVAGTSGDESAFALSENNGNIFDDISLIDTAISVARDVAVSRDGNKVYLVSENGTDTSLWCFNTIWRRVYLERNSANFIVRISPTNSSIVYLAERGTDNVSFNNASGRGRWLFRTCPVNVQDMAVESSGVIYVIDAAGVASKNINNGLLWTNTGPTKLANGATITSVSPDIVLAGSQDGYVAYSLDGGVIWTNITQRVQAGAGNIQVIADENFATNYIIYAASNTPGSNIMKWTIGVSTAWTDIFAGNTVGGIFGLAITDNTLYALEYNGGTGQSTLWRHIAPATATVASGEWTASSTNITTDPTDPTVALNAAPQALKASSAKLWAVKTNGTNRLYSWTDVIGSVQLALLHPKDGFRLFVNRVTTLSYDVTFSWGRPSVATAYELMIAQNLQFNPVLVVIPVIMDAEIAYVTVGPSQTGINQIFFTPGETYYWRVRVTTPGFSPYSQVRYFVVDPIVGLVPELVTPHYGEMAEGPYPTFSWHPLADVTEYEFMLSDNPAMISPIVDKHVETTSIKLNIMLEPGERYWWQVRASKPVLSLWSFLGTFTGYEETETLSPLIIEQGLTPTAVLTATAPPLPFLSIFTENYLPLIIFIIVVLLIVVVYYLVSGRPLIKLPAFISQRERPPRIGRVPGVEPSRPAGRPEPPREIAGKPAEPEPTIPHPSLAEKNKEGAAVIFAAKSFMWMVTQEEITAEGLKGLSEKERQSLGKKLAGKIHDLARKENIYLKYPQDAPMLLSIWARYSSRKETSNYLAKSFEANPYNAIKLLKCYVPAPLPGREPPPAEAFTMAQYTSVAEVIESDLIYAALTKLFKFKAETIEDKVPVVPADRNLAFQFMRLHINTKS